MMKPLKAAGTFSLGLDDTLIRHQTEPTEEIMEIGKRFIKLTRKADGYENTVPIPDHLLSFLTVMRAIVRGDSSALMDDKHNLVIDANGWSLRLVFAGQSAIEMLGCGETLNAISMALETGEQRLIVFTPPL